MDLEEKKISDAKVAEIKARQRHDVLNNKLNSIVEKLSETNGDGTAAAIEKHSEAIKGFVDAVKNMPKPEVKVEQNHTEVVSSIQDMCQKILDGLSALQTAIEDKPMVDSFKLVRGNHGYTETVNVNYKKAKDISIKAKQYGVN